MSGQAVGRGTEALRCSGMRTWDGIRGFPGMSFTSPKVQQKSETSAAEAENTFMCILLYQHKSEKQRGSQNWCENTSTSPSGEVPHFSESVLRSFCLPGAKEVCFVLETSLSRS